MEKAVIYARYSSNNQTEDSIHAQVRACEEYATQQGIKIVGIYKDEAVSGRESKTELRRDYQRMLREVKKHSFDIILVHKYDRVARSIAEHVNLEVRLQTEGIKLIAVGQDFGNSTESKLMKSITWALSEYYSDNLASETKKGHRETALKGLHNGGYPPFGYNVVEQKYVINELEAAYVRKMFNAALNCLGFSELIEEMRNAGIKGKRGKEIGYSQISEILKNEKYTGVYLYSMDEEQSRTDRRIKPNAIRIEDAFPVIVDKATFEQVQKIRQGKKQAGRRADYLCSGLVYCGNCGAKMHVYTSVRKGHVYPYYRCSKGCGASAVKVNTVDNVAKRYIRDLLSDDTQQKIANVLRTYQGHDRDRIDSFYAAIKKKIKEKETAYNNLLTNMASAVLPPEVIADLSNKMATLKAEIAELREAEPPVDYTASMIKDWLSSIRDTPDSKALRLLINRIVAIRDKNKTDFNIESTLKPVLENMVAGEGFEPTTSGL